MTSKILPEYAARSLKLYQQEKKKSETRVEVPVTRIPQESDRTFRLEDLCKFH